MKTKDIPKGYKDSPVGVIPEDWQVQEFGKLGKFVGGGTPSTAVANYWEGDIPWISSSDIFEDDIKSISITRYITKQAIKESSTKLITKGSVIFVSRVGVGKLAVNNLDLCTSQDFVNFTPSSKKISSLFVGYYFLKNNRLFQSYKQGTSIKGFTQTNLKKIKIAFPPIQEQEKIVEVLLTWDKAIEKQTQLIEKLEERKKGLMQQLLTGKKRLPGFSGDWKEVKLSDIAKLYQPGTIPRSHFCNTGYPVYGANGIIGYFKKFNHEYSQIVVGCRGNCGSVNLTKPRSWINGNAMVVNVDNNRNVNKQYLFYYLKNDNLFYLITGSGQPQITGDIKKHKVKLPKLEEQKAITAIINKADNEIDCQKEKLNQLKLQKKGLMQQLLTGKKRVKIQDKQ